MWEHISSTLDSHSDSAAGPASTEPVEAVLEGGPADLTTAQRRRLAVPTDQKIKVVHRGGYEHFERVGSATAGGNSRPVVFRWITRTKIAE